ncbi:MAG: RodZ domain-containing protein [Arenimonas sp.]
MSPESFQDTLFEDPIGLKFRHCREKQRLSLESVAQQLKLPLAILDAIEREDWPRLGAPIFVRSYVGSYAKFLGLPATLADDVVRGKPAPQLAAVGTVPPARRMFDRGVMNLAYLAMTVVILGSVVALAMYFQGPRRSTDVLPPDATATYAGSETGPAPVDAVPAPVTASMAPTLPDSVPAAVATPAGSLASPADGTGIVLRFRGDSWVDIVDRKGAHVERGVLPAGTERRYPGGQLAEVTLGDASAVEVRSGGLAVDLAPYREAKVAHFTVSSEGRIGASASD